jgi:hypothetical protein
MKFYILYIVIFLSLAALAQTNKFEKNRYLYNESVDSVNYEEYTLKAVDVIASLLESNKLDSIQTILKEWTYLRGKNEVTLRITIIVDFLQNKDVTKHLKEYINNDYYVYLYDRFTMNDKYGYRREYNEYKSYYNYVPIEHPIDSLLNHKAKIILEKPHSLDEELLLILFSGKLIAFDDALKKRKYEKGIFKPFIRKNNYNVSNSFSGTFELYTGIYATQGEAKVFGNNPSIGVAVSSNLHKFLVYGLQAKFRPNIDDKRFNFFALDSLHSVNSKLSFSVGYFFGFKLYDGKRLKIIPKIYHGFEVVTTGISEKDSKQDNSIIYHNVDTSHVTFSLALMTPILRKSYVGLQLGYHYVPYKKDHNLQTEFNDKALSVELFFRY